MIPRNIEVALVRFWRWSAYAVMGLSMLYAFAGGEPFWGWFLLAFVMAYFAKWIEMVHLPRVIAARDRVELEDERA